MTRDRTPSPATRTALAFFLGQPGHWQHGYDICRQTGLKSGTLYPLLIRLEERGLLEADWEDSDQPGKPPRHIYRLTQAGIAYAQTHVESSGQARATLQQSPLGAKI